MKTISKILGLCLLSSSIAFAQDSQEVDDTYFFTTDRAIPSSIAKDARLKPVVNPENNVTSKYANPDFNGDVSLSDESFDYYSENPINDQYVFGSNTFQNNYGYGFGNSGWGMNPYSGFNDPFFSPYYPYASRWGMGFSPWGTGFGMNRGFGMGFSPWGSGFGMGFNSMFGPNLGWGMGFGNGFYDPFMNPYWGSGLAFNSGFGMFGNRFYRPSRVVVVERPIRSASQRFNRGNSRVYSRTADNSGRIASYNPSSDANRVASSRIRNVSQLQQRINDRNNGRLSNTSNNVSRSSYSGRSNSFSSGRSSSNSRYGGRSSSPNYNSGRSSYSSPSFSSPSRSGGSFGGSSGGRSSAPVRRGRQ